MSNDQGKQKHWFIFYFISKLGRELHKKENKTQPYSMPETKFHSQLRCMKQPSAMRMEEMARQLPSECYFGLQPWSQYVSREGENRTAHQELPLTCQDLGSHQSKVFMRVFQPCSGFNFHGISVSGLNRGYIAQPSLNTATPLPAAVLSSSLGITRHLFPS